jgi:hypothetical protein
MVCQPTSRLGFALFATPLERLRTDFSIIDAVPKKRGPKTDVLEALLKRVDGLEKRLHSEGKSDALPDAESSTSQDESSSGDNKPSHASPHQTRPMLEIAPNPANAAHQLMSPIEPRYLQTILIV